MNPGAHVGVLPSGQLTAPAQTTKQTDAAHFKIKYIVSSLDFLHISLIEKLRIFYKYYHVQAWVSIFIG